jgi:hypothetical protein
MSGVLDSPRATGANSLSNLYVRSLDRTADVGTRGPRNPGPSITTREREESTIANSQRLETLRRAFWVALILGAILFMAMQIVVNVRAGVIGADSP